MGILFTILMGILFTILLGIQFTISSYKKDDIIPKSHYLWTPMKIVFY